MISLVCSNDLSVFHRFFDTTTFTMYITACAQKTVAITDREHLPVHVYTKRS